MIKCKYDSDRTESSNIDTEESSIPNTKVTKTDTSNFNIKTEKPIKVSDESSNEITKEEIVKSETPPVKKETKKPIQTKPVVPKAKKETKKRKTVPAKQPKIEFEELVWDFGEITEGDIIEKKFKFTNTGNAVLEIIATSATCGCTRPSFPFLDIAPGESNEIGVTYNSVNKDGEQDPEITVESNTIPKITILKLKGTVKPKPKKEEIPDSSSTVKDSIVLKQK